MPASRNEMKAGWDMDLCKMHVGMLLLVRVMQEVQMTAECKVDQNGVIP
jgi:hypothetical protein